MHSATHVAAIDIGSNSIRGVVAAVSADGTYRIVDDERFQTRLGAELARTGSIPVGRIEASISALEHLARIAASRRADVVRAVATAAVRSADNGPEFLAAVRDRLGLEIEVIDGVTEAHFAYLSAAANFTLPDPSLVVDIGGGSLEMVVVRRGQATDVHSLPLGAVRLLGELPADEDPPSTTTLVSLSERVHVALAQAFGDDPPHVTTIIGSGGTVTSLVGIAAAARGEDPFSLQGAEISAAELDRIVTRLGQTAAKQRARIPGLAAYRADTVVPGGIVVRQIMSTVGAQRLLANQRGLREGILLDTIARLGRDRAPVTLRDAAAGFGSRCRYDAAHAAHVTAHALSLFDQLTPDLPARLDARDRELLEAAAIMHDVGYLLGHDKHHRHSWHLIAHAGLPGLTARETAIVAALARYHRGSAPKESHEAWRRIAPEDRARVSLLAGILRTADGLDRAQTGQVSRVTAAFEDETLRIRVAGHGDLDVDIRGAQAKSALLASAIGTPVEISAE